jgi:hypothetical protein
MSAAAQYVLLNRHPPVSSAFQRNTQTITVSSVAWQTIAAAILIG